MAHPVNPEMFFLDWENAYFDWCTQQNICSVKLTDTQLHVKSNTLFSSVESMLLLTYPGNLVTSVWLNNVLTVWVVSGVPSDCVSLLPHLLWSTVFKAVSVSMATLQLLYRERLNTVGRLRQQQQNSNVCSWNVSVQHVEHKVSAITTEESKKKKWIWTHWWTENNQKCHQYHQWQFKVTI